MTITVKDETLKKGQTTGTTQKFSHEKSWLVMKFPLKYS